MAPVGLTEEREYVMYDNDPIVEITPITSVRICVRDQECMVSVDVWEKALEILDIIADYTAYINVDKVKAIKAVRAACGAGLRDTKLMTEAYFEPKMAAMPERGWRQYS